MAEDPKHVDLYVRKFNRNAGTLIVTVHETKEFRLRIWLAVTLIRLAGWILGTGSRVEQEENNG